ncbi:MAG: MFS transporter [Lachnospiraceae bacterium]|nr:MFS transporter [Lachnospiraceae bacterium]
MRVTGAKRWLVLALGACLGGVMNFVPFLRYSYYDQMVTVFTDYANIVDAANANEFIGNIGLAFGIFSVLMYPVGGILADKFSERNLLVIGALIMGISSFIYGMIPSALILILIHVALGIGTSVFIWSAYLKVVRKMGTGEEQGKVYSVSEFVRGLLGTLVGFAGVALLNMAIMGDGTTDPIAMGHQFRNMLWLIGAVFVILAVLIFIFIPKEIIGAEVKQGEEEQVPFTMANIGQVLKLPGVWLISLLILFCFSMTSAASGYLGAYTTACLGISTTLASSFSIVRVYIIACLSTLAIGFIADKIGSTVKTLGFYAVAATITTAGMLLTQSFVLLCITISFIFAIAYTGMRGIYFATLAEVGIPLHLTGVATGVISLICYLPDIYFAKIAGIWLDKFGNTGYTYIWLWTIACGILAVITAWITYGYARKVMASR